MNLKNKKNVKFNFSKKGFSQIYFKIIFMKFQELRKNIQALLQNRRQDTSSEIAQEDINLVQHSKYEIPTKTIICFGILYFMKYSARFFHLPRLFVNPLADGESIIYRKKIWSRIMANHLIFLGTMGCLLIYSVKYEIIKFYIYLKYENLVHNYMDALDRRQMIYLKTIDSEKL